MSKNYLEYITERVLLHARGIAGLFLFTTYSDCLLTHLRYSFGISKEHRKVLYRWNVQGIALFPTFLTKDLMSWYIYLKDKCTLKPQSSATAIYTHISDQELNTHCITSIASLQPTNSASPVVICYRLIQKMKQL